MQKNFTPIFRTVLLAAFLLLTACGTDTTSAVSTSVAAVPTQASAISYSSNIDPILQRSCFECHGGEKTSKGLSVATYDALMKGSQNGAVILAGEPDKSKFLLSILSGKMPKKGNKLTAEEIQLIRQWILEGANNN